MSLGAWGLLQRLRRRSDGRMTEDLERELCVPPGSLWDDLTELQTLGLAENLGYGWFATELARELLDRGTAVVTITWS